MTPKEQADELRKAMFQPIFDIDSGVHTAHDKGRYLAAIQCALIAVDEILQDGMLENAPFMANGKDLVKSNYIRYKDYWQQVKNELLKQQNS